MKQIITILFCSNLILLLLQCRKKESDIVNVNFNKDCYAGSFNTNLSQAVHVVGIIQNNDHNFNILTTVKGQAQLSFYDSHGHPIKSKSINLPKSSMAISFIITPDGGFIISAANSQYQTTSAVTPSTNYTYISENALNPCNSGLNYVGYSYPYKISTNLSTSYLIKIDADGNIIWQKNYSGNFFVGSSLATNGSNIYLLTLNNDLNYRIDTSSGYSYVLYCNVADSNTATIYKLDYNGNTNWSKTFTGVTGIVNRLDSIPIEQASIKADNQKIVFQSGITIIAIDPNGKLLSRPDISSILCAQNTYNGYQFAAVELDSAGFDVYLPATGLGFTSIVVNYDLKGYVKNSFGFNNAILKSRLINFYKIPNVGFKFYDGVNLVLTDLNGKIIYNHTEFPYSSYGFLMPSTFINTCDSGTVLFAGTDLLAQNSGTGFNQLQLIKIDKNGN